MERRLFQSLLRLSLRLLRDPRGNALGLIAAALIPLLAMTGGAIDMGRSYLSQSRLQQACDCLRCSSGKPSVRSRAGEWRPSRRSGWSPDPCRGYA